MDTPTRKPLDRHRLWSQLSDKSDFWTEIDVVQTTESTNVDLADAAKHGAREGRVLIAEEQSGGRGRLDRQWVSPARAGLTMSFLLRPAAPREQWGTLSLLTAVALEETLKAVCGVSAKLKWPNDVLIDGRKVCGILAQVEGGAVIVGAGLNVSLAEEELPVPEATSLLLAGASTLDREAIAVGFLAHVAAVYQSWNERGPASVIERWRRHSATLGRHVEVSFPNGRKVTGRAIGIDNAGCLQVSQPDGAVATVAAGDIVHLRPQG
ncbi:biotin--[acetyl-CoA-carboxylase] ligase [Glycomyces sp. TRM65418]|uniref:biotin--[acetyl-CoA-carboxylase] ligase n=1 Tax=Glycomyces sp. TRM65418 TaxID=2867006 RepID=UPI001CE6BA67|nr:biotin--[acetyl-CoA-carboxylase] ligase [Glycomyces sp. TRM65418]MCC3762933.1 biotin--[acetyl-CoA-carboxylase] ligase [Glycomyces sp. TRM65418]QZD56957.1 biotin--[acetyl-CoA-carboxylase] ligase [Glycomyces sp. TRM65418]